MLSSDSSPKPLRQEREDASEASDTLEDELDVVTRSRSRLIWFVGAASACSLLLCGLGVEIQQVAFFIPGVLGFLAALLGAALLLKQQARWSEIRAELRAENWGGIPRSDEDSSQRLES